MNSTVTPIQSSAPVEFRYFLRRFTLEDARMGVQPVRLTVGKPDERGQQPFDVFVPQPELQYRYKERVYQDGKPLMQWSPWLTIPAVRDGDA